MARSALRRQQRDLLQEIRDIQSRLDKDSADTAAAESLKEKKAELAEVIVSRETLYYVGF
jgi:hypothetical protein